MAGITGWVDFLRDISQDLAVARHMTATLATRGPDDERVWASAHAVLGHRRLAIADPTPQPLVVRAGDRVVVVTFDGELFNRASLGERLGLTGSDPELVVAAYLKWGERCVDQLDGSFAFGIWDENAEELLIARDHIGLRPLYYHPTPSGVLFASEPKALLSHPQVDVVVDLDGFREALSFAGTPGHAVYRGMRKVEGGELIRFGRSGMIRRRYWRLEDGEHTDDLDTTVGRIRELLADAVARRIATDDGFSIMLSGGLDSSLITALASRALRERGVDSVRTMAVDFIEHAVNARAAGTDDSTFAAEMARHIGTDHRDIMLDRSLLLGALPRAAAVRAYPDLPCPVGEMTTALYVFFKAVAQNTSVTMMGEWADTLFGAFLRLEDPEVVARQTLPWVASGQLHVRSTGLGSGLFEPTLLKQLDLPGYCAERYRDELAGMPSGGAESEHDRRMREISYLYLRGWMEMGLAQDDGLTSAHGLRFRAPFADPALMQYVYTIPWSMKTFDGRAKGLLRKVAEGLVPQSILDRPKNPFPSTPDLAHAAALREEALAVLADPASPVLPLIDVDATKTAVSTVEELAAGWQSRGDVEMVLQVNTWLADYRPRLEL
ncbi:asparagine synthase (glutamine-hydrolyzing) [Saccharothrix tamanrassetensis]|uniref:asparagine synthase (glutamine-hydrolyzing) n=1 Tax=Saccharothrix tamanrassetensis TaxID=1051531 RepID=A0A841CJ26_9PSEU|nr:asparagine synthase (glutamine-hydrolyzing) [Saccharothrix tamanrassetensis]MBB5957451.1 asparagine synthase (glutamine-hydrolyzing) [Saccharothrix tamanrassetensis]